MNTTPTAVQTDRTCPEPRSVPAPNPAAVQAWHACLVALDELTARWAAAHQQPYTQPSPAMLAAMAADLAGSGLTPDEAACCAFAWPPTTPWRPADVGALVAEYGRPAQLLP